MSNHLQAVGITTVMRLPLMNEHQCADYRNVKVSKIREERVKGKGPPFIKDGASVRYRPEDVDAWLDARRCTSTTVYGKRGSGELITNDKQTITTDNR